MARKRTPTASNPAAPYPAGFEPFIAAIQAALDDDTPRVVFADWLEEHGDPDRAEFIRAQCELERLRAEGRRNLALGRRGKELLAAHADRWTEPLREAKVGGKWHFRRRTPKGSAGFVSSTAKVGGEWQFRRGFVEHVTMSATRFVRVAAKLFRLAPTVRSALPRNVTRSQTKYRKTAAASTEMPNRGTLLIFTPGVPSPVHARRPTSRH